jgi:hypothetical protein
MKKGCKHVRKWNTVAGVLQQGERQLVCVTYTKFLSTLDDQLGYQKKRKILKRAEGKRNGLPDVQCRIAPNAERVSHDKTDLTGVKKHQVHYDGAQGCSFALWKLITILISHRPSPAFPRSVLLCPPV